MKWMFSVLSISLGLSSTVLKADCPPAEQPSNVVIEARVTTAGPYGELWEVSVTPEGRAYLVILYGIDPLGHLCGEFLLGTDRLAELQQKAASSSFFELPEKLEPTQMPIHAPDLKLSMSRDGKMKSVALYNPEAVVAGPQKTQFFALWNALFAMLPVQPKW